MEINEEVLNNLAQTLTTNKLNDSMVKTQAMMDEVKRIIREVAEQYPEATQEEVLQRASEVLDERDREQQIDTEKPKNDEEIGE